MLREHSEKKTDKWSVGSRKKLKAHISYRIKRIFAAYLDILEYELNLKEKDPKLFERLRKKILTIGNDQIRNVDNILERYNIEYIAYSYDLEVLTMDELIKKIFKEKEKEEDGQS